MVGSKRSADSVVAHDPQRKRVKVSENAVEQNKAPVSVLRPEEVDFPRGGGTSFTPVEYKAIRSEALKELNDEVVFKVSTLLYRYRKRSES